MRNLFISSLLLFIFGTLTSVYADDDDRNKGVEISTEQKSDQGLEHGKAYAGDKEQKEKSDRDKGDKEKKQKGDKDKGDKEKKQKGDKDKGDKEKKGDKDKGDKEKKQKGDKSKK